ncbi:MAG: RIP metalloprotease RseP [Hyphomicrobiales bacterium]
MDLLSGLINYGGTTLTYVLPFLFVLTIIVFFHELGHFMVARWAGISVETFSVGFGREIFGFTDSKQTRWKFSWIPLGGYVKFLGDENAASMPDRETLEEMPEAERKGSFYHASVGRRSAVVVAGPVANFLLSIVIFALLFMIVGRTEVVPIVGKVHEESAAQAAGFQSGDVVRSIDGAAIEQFTDIQRIVQVKADTTLKIVVERNGELVTLTATPTLTERTDSFGNKHRIGLLGIAPAQGEGSATLRHYGPVSAVWLGVEETWFAGTSLLGYLRDVIVGRQDANQIGGPLRIAQISGQSFQISVAAMFNLAAILSVTIGLINLFPIPMLDGGHLLYYGIEAVRGRPLSDRMQDVGFRVGIALVLALMLFATWNDLAHFNNLLTGGNG